MDMYRYKPGTDNRHVVGGDSWPSLLLVCPQCPLPTFPYCASFSAIDAKSSSSLLAASLMLAADLAGPLLLLLLLLLRSPLLFCSWSAESTRSSVCVSLTSTPFLQRCMHTFQSQCVSKLEASGLIHSTRASLRDRSVGMRACSTGKLTCRRSHLSHHTECTSDPAACGCTPLA